MFLLQMAIQVILSSVLQSTFSTWKEAVVVVFSLVSIEIFLSSKTLLAYSTGKMHCGVCLDGGVPLIDSFWQRFVVNIHRNASVKDKCIFTTRINISTTC
jgi:hypothetical protein